MKTRILVLFFLVTALTAALLSVKPVSAQTPPGSYQGKPLCLPDVYASDPVDCIFAGPAAQVTAQQAPGLTNPMRPLPAYHPDESLTIAPSNIAKINLDDNMPAPLYATLDDAINQRNPVRYIPPAVMRYIEYSYFERYNNKDYLQVATGEWIRASRISYSKFMGWIFTETPKNNFGWVLDFAEVRSAPGYSAPKIGELAKLDSIQIYAMEPMDGTDWYQIGPDRWVERRWVRELRIDTTRPPGVPADVNKWISINLYDQTLAAYENNKLVFAALIASGAEPLYTQPGSFQIYKKLDASPMMGATNADRSDYYYLEGVPWSMYYDKMRAIHGAYWRAWFGIEQSHGCVNMSVGDSNWLYHWADEGDWVYVWDPSGKTPTDPALYGDGGA
ncbi:MAG TPA: L,D-transpeptidase family protein [Bellilinea sp.]|nr:L,D-transpeptidase family protein [Bellilinea sp.]